MEERGREGEREKEREGKETKESEARAKAKAKRDASDPTIRNESCPAREEKRKMGGEGGYE